jgi:hypothetical protein
LSGKLGPIFKVPFSNNFLFGITDSFFHRTKFQSIIWWTGDDFIFVLCFPELSNTHPQDRADTNPHWTPRIHIHCNRENASNKKPVERYSGKTFTTIYPSAYTSGNEAYRHKRTSTPSLTWKKKKDIMKRKQERRGIGTWTKGDPHKKTVTTKYTHKNETPEGVGPWAETGTHTYLGSPQKEQPYGYSATNYHA